MATLSTTPVPATPADSRQQRNLASFAWITLGWNVLVIVYATLVRATGSGAGCGNHWPLCNGQVIPLSPTLHTIIEFTHRVTTFGSIVTMVALVVFTRRLLPKQHPARRAVNASAIFLVIEALLGALLVKLDYVTGNASTGRVVMFSIHFGNTLLLLASLTLSAWLLSGRRIRIDRISTPGWLTIAATMVVGISGSLAALGDTLFPSSSLRAAFAQDLSANAPMLLRLRGVHPLSVALASGLMLWLIVKNRAISSDAQRLSSIVVTLLALQIAAGITDLLLLAPSWMQLLHLLLADLYWIAALLFIASTTQLNANSYPAQ